jgi:hypothetical protein
MFVCILDVTGESTIEGVEFEFGNKYATLNDDSSWPNSNNDNGWGQDSDGPEENTKDTQDNWGISRVNDSDISTSSTKRTLSPHISTNDDNSDDASTSSAAKKTKLG